MKTIGQAAKANKAIGNKWFNKDTLNFWDTYFWKPGSASTWYCRPNNWQAIPLIDEKYFVHRSTGWNIEKFALCEVLEDGSIKTLFSSVSFDDVKEEIPN